MALLALKVIAIFIHIRSLGRPERSGCVLPPVKADLPTRVFMRLRYLCALPLFAVLLAVACSAKEPPVPALVDLTTPDKIKLHATYFAAAGPGPGILLWHQRNRHRNVWA